MCEMTTKSKSKEKTRLSVNCTGNVSHLLKADETQSLLHLDLNVKYSAFLYIKNRMFKLFYIVFFFAVVANHFQNLLITNFTKNNDQKERYLVLTHRFVLLS